MNFGRGPSQNPQKLTLAALKFGVGNVKNHRFQLGLVRFLTGFYRNTHRELVNTTTKGRTPPDQLTAEENKDKASEYQKPKEENELTKEEQDEEDEKAIKQEGMEEEWKPLTKGQRCIKIIVDNQTQTNNLVQKQTTTTQSVLKGI